MTIFEIAHLSLTIILMLTGIIMGLWTIKSVMKSTPEDNDNIPDTK